MTRVIDAPEAIELLERAVQAKGEDYVDPRAVSGEGCEYSDENGYPACIVGHVFSYLGVDLTMVDGGSVYLVADSEGVAGHYGNIIEDSPAFTEAAVSALGDAQSIQDTKGTWGEALASAKSRWAVSA